MNKDIINYYSDKINIDYANNIKNIVKKIKNLINLLNYVLDMILHS